MNWKKLLVCLAIPLAVGGLSVLFSGGMADYMLLNQPPLSPPGWLFPIVWTVLYLVMGYASYRVLIAGGNSKGALRLYGAQLAVNFLWPLIFFGLSWYLTAFFLLVILWVLILLTQKAFSQVDPVSADLLIPYLLWVTFAGYLNFGVFLLN